MNEVTTSSLRRTPPRGIPRLSWWKRVSVAWKVLGFIAAILGTGWVGHAYTTQYVTGEDLKNHAAGENGLRLQLEQLASEVTSLKVEIAATRTDVAAVREASTTMRDDVRSLTEFLLRRSPPQRQP